MIYKHFLLAATLVLSSCPVFAAPAGDSLDRDYGGELTRPQPVEPADALATFTVQPPFRMELVAAEPLVRDPLRWPSTSPAASTSSKCAAIRSSARNT
ncbi:MAG: hypothetical protein HC888_18455 [Candidatus Competibacteraceae bacterium]|nr:hypothetical protein [Candidatus Competibacteraceae bacterium]